MSEALTQPGFWAGLLGRLTGRQRLDPGQKVYPFEAHASAAGSAVTAEGSLKLSAVWGCVSLNSAITSSLPLHLRTPDKKLAVDEPLYRLLHDAPNADMTSSEWLETQSASLDLWGNGYSEIAREGSRIVALTPLAPDRVVVKRREDGRLRYLLKVGNREREIDEDDILHLRGFTLDGLIGLSPVQFAAETMGGLMDANRAATADWRNGMRVGMVVSTPPLTADQRISFKARLQELAGPDRTGENLLLEKPFEIVDPKGIRINPIDAQLLESRYFGIEEICRAFRVPPQLIGHTDKASSWASSLENTNLGYLMYGLRPRLVRIEQQLSRKLLSPEQRQKLRPKFAIEGLLRADSAGRAALFTSALQNGWMTRNEVREMEDLPRIEGGDTLTVQTNLAPIDQLGKAPAAAEAARTALMDWLRSESQETTHAP